MQIVRLFVSVLLFYCVCLSKYLKFNIKTIRTLRHFRQTTLLCIKRCTTYFRFYEYFEYEFDSIYIIIQRESFLKIYLKFFIDV